MNPARIHGGADALGVPRHDFSTNSNACGPCPEALAAVQAADASRYPDPSYAVLREQLADWHGVESGRVLLAASASEFIYRVSAWAAQRGPRTVWMPMPCYGDYAAAAVAWGLLRERRAEDAGLVWACEPSSPLGQNEEGLASHMLSAPVCVLDRAYEPLRIEGKPSLTEDELQRVWQLWTPNKALGLTGVRAAYVIAPWHATTAVAQLEALAPSWLIGAHGVAMLQAWTRPGVQAWLKDTLDTLRVWKARQIGLCQDMGWRCTPSVANFFCASASVQAPALPGVLQELRERGIKLRAAASFGLPGQVRLAVLPPASQDALRAAWDGVFEDKEALA